jgi:hypothetical protein
MVFKFDGDSATAKQFADINERRDITRRRDHVARSMDLHNNAVGRAFGSQLWTSSGTRGYSMLRRTAGEGLRLAAEVRDVTVAGSSLWVVDSFGCLMALSTNERVALGCRGV